MYKFFQEQLNNKINNLNLRTLTEYCPIDAVRVKRDDKEYLMMASNNYLGLTFDERVIEGAIKGSSTIWYWIRWIASGIRYISLVYRS